MKQRVEEMEREANKLRELQAEAEKQENGGPEGDASVPMETEEDRALADQRSIFIGNVPSEVAKSRVRGAMPVRVCIALLTIGLFSACVEETEKSRSRARTQSCH